MLVDSNEAGSHFRLELPLVVGTEKPAEQTQPDLETSKPKRSEEKKNAKILVVDDVAGNREVIVAMLRDKPYQIVEAVDGEDATKIFADQRPDLVLMDFGMPNVSWF